MRVAELLLGSIALVGIVFSGLLQLVFWRWIPESSPWRWLLSFAGHELLAIVLALVLF
jgi:hypothetical protein